MVILFFLWNLVIGWFEKKYIKLCIVYMNNFSIFMLKYYK